MYRLVIASIFAAACAALVPTAAAADLVIGQVAPFSGPLAPTGAAMRSGLQLAIDQANAAGGIGGARLRLVSKDDRYDAAETVKLTRELLREAKPVAFAGLVGTGNIEALKREKVLAEAGVPAIGLRSGAASLRTPVDPWLFHTRASYADEITRIVEHLAAIGVRNFGVLYQDDAFGKDGLAASQAAVAAAKGTIVATGAYEKNTTKVEAALAALLAKPHDAVIMVSNTAASAEFIKQYKAAGGTAMLYTLSVSDGPQIVARVGGEIAHGTGLTQVTPPPTAVDSRLARELQEAARRHGAKDLELNHTVFEGYLAGKVLIEGLRRAGNNPTPDKLRTALESLRNYDAGDLAISYSPQSHAGSRFVEITMLRRDGKLAR